jgi:phthalate 4,5-cis-dihydrodiol dehydrogenase
MADLKVGVAGLGTASRLILPYFGTVEGVGLAAAADTRAEAREAFTKAYGLPVFGSVEELCGMRELDAVWIETPNRFHAEHAIAAMRAGKHVICAKPLATTLEQCDRMIAASRSAGVRLMVAHSKIFDAPIQAMAKIARSGRLGKVVQIDSWLFNDWLRRPRLESELDETAGEGFILRQAPHLVDIATFIAGGRAARVRAMSGKWDPAIPAEGNCAALIGFEDGAFASLSMNGYGYFDGSELTFGISVFGEKRERKVPRPRGAPLSTKEKFSVAPAERTQGKAQPFFGLTIVSCERGVMRQSPEGLLVYTDEGCEEIALPENPGRAAELYELRDAVREKRDVFPNGEWGKRNLEICLAVMRSAREGKDVVLESSAPASPGCPSLA